MIIIGVAAPVLAATTYKVKSGDSLFKISRWFGTTVRALQEANALGYSSLIYPGQELVVSQESRREAPPAVSRGNSSRASINYTTPDVDLLARLITAEAGGESYPAQVAVGAVIINRVQSPIFPNNISSVIYQVEYGRYQFTPVLNGWINRPATASALKAAREALAGSDPTNGALFFFQTGTPNTYLQAKPVSAVIDDLTFAL